MKKSFAVRSIAVSAFLAASAMSAHADLTIPFDWTNSNSVQKFPVAALQSFDLLYVEVAALGNATSKNDVPEGLAVPNAQSYNFPVTKIVIGSKLNIASGSAVGSALRFRYPTDEGVYLGLTLANFTIDYTKNQVTADATATTQDATVEGSKEVAVAPAKRIAIYDFHVATPLALKYKFPLTVTGHEVLDQLKLTADAKAAFTTALALPDFAVAQLDQDFGTLTQDISTTTRKPKLASTQPYVVK